MNRRHLLRALLAAPILALVASLPIRFGEMEFFDWNSATFVALTPDLNGPHGEFFLAS